nr:LysM domain receptor-like kinase 3 [Tanacetum cinerariifolium]
MGDNYLLDSVQKMAQLAKACTHENPQLRPCVRSIVVALMTLSLSTKDWDVGSFDDNQTLKQEIYIALTFPFICDIGSLKCLLSEFCGLDARAMAMAEELSQKTLTGA